ncbi:hypothetical protein LOZ36_003341 [Ophidiomyces ophidiicola]|nr:hypothetical protein LOZ36_003341 [Ophidiomyces ophidiicola]
MASRFESFRDRFASLVRSPEPTGHAVVRPVLQPAGRGSKFRRLFFPSTKEPRFTTHTISGALEGPSNTTISTIPETTEQHQGTQTPPNNHEEQTTRVGDEQPQNARWIRQPRKRRRIAGRFRLSPGFGTREAKKKMMSCVISGSILAVVLAVYMALTLTTTITGREFHIFLILMLMMLTMYFCHSFIRLFIIASRGPDEEFGRRMRFAELDHPIPVRFARDEEIVAGDAEDNNQNTHLAAPPPAYGLWRESMRINPNMIYWQRVEQPESPQVEESRPATANRPPSYVSDDGVQYVVEVQPRSLTRPTSHMPDIPVIVLPEESNIQRH